MTAKLVSSFFERDIQKALSCYFHLDKLIQNDKFSLPAEDTLWYLSKWQLGYFAVLAFYRTVENQLFSGVKYLNPQPPSVK